MRVIIPQKGDAAACSQEFAEWLLNKPVKDFRSCEDRCFFFYAGHF